MVVELHTHLDQVADLVRGLLHNHFDHRFITKSVAGDYRVVHMVLETVFWGQHPGYSTLGPSAVADLDFFFRNDNNPLPGRDRQSSP